MKLLCYVPQMAAYGGIEQHVCGLVSHLARQGHEVRLITTSNSLGPDLRGTLLDAGVSLREYNRARGRASRLGKLAWLARETALARLRRWDLIYTNGQSGLAALPWLAGQSDTRVVHHHHTAADESEQRTWSPSFRRVLRRASEVVGCSVATRDAIGRAVGRDDIRFLPYLTPALFEASEITNRRPDSGAPINIGFMGRLVPEKGLARLRSLAERVGEADGVAWHIHGAGPLFPPEYFAEVEGLHYHGRFNGIAERRQILQHLDALVLFSTHNEGMPLSLIEGMSAGLPWMATAQGGTAEIAVSPADCRVLSREATLDEQEAAVREFAAAIRAGETSRTRQRAAYDLRFAPAQVAADWEHYFLTAAVSPGVRLRPLAPVSR